MQIIQRGMQAHPVSGTTPELVQAIQQAALATEAEGWHDLAQVLRGWAEQVRSHGEWERRRQHVRQSDTRIG